jgi:hypothetical protein
VLTDLLAFMQRLPCEPSYGKKTHASQGDSPALPVIDKARARPNSTNPYDCEKNRNPFAAMLPRLDSVFNSTRYVSCLLLRCFDLLHRRRGWAAASQTAIHRGSVRLSTR